MIQICKNLYHRGECCNWPWFWERDVEGGHDAKFWGSKKEQMTLQGSESNHVPLRALVLTHDDQTFNPAAPETFFNFFLPFSSSRVISMNNLVSYDRPYRAGANWRIIKLPAKDWRTSQLKNLRDKHEVQLIFGSWESSYCHQEWQMLSLIRILRCIFNAMTLL